MRATSRRSLVAAGLGLLACSAGLAWWLARAADGGDRGAPPEHAARRAAEAGPDFATRDGTSAAVVPLQPATFEVAPPAAEATLAVLAGRITFRDDGTPVPGVTLDVWAWNEERQGLRPVEAQTRATTDADGCYRFAYTAACRVVSVSVAPGPGSSGAQHSAPLELQPGQPCTLDLQVGRGAALAGLVLDTLDRPVPGAQVRAWSHGRSLPGDLLGEPQQHVAAGHDGSFRLEALGPYVALWAEAPGHLGLTRVTGHLDEGARWGLAAGGPPIEPPLVLRLSPVRELRGRVLDPDGQPLARVHVVARLADDPEATELTGVPGLFAAPAGGFERRSDAQGRFSATVSSETYAVRAWTDGLQPWRGRHAPGDPDLVVQFRRGASVSGTVTSAVDGRPLPAHLTLHAFTDDGTTTQSASSDEHGRFVLGGLPESGRAELDVTSPGHALHVLHPLGLDGRDPALRLVLEPELTLAGRVVDAQGAALGGAPVRLQGDRVLDLPGEAAVPTWESRVGLDETWTDAEGRFRFGQLYAGRFTLRATHPLDAALTATLQAEAGAEDLRLVLDPESSAGLTLHGTVTDALTGRPVTSFRVTPLRAEAQGLSGSTWVLEDAAGAYRIAHLEPGEWLVRASAQGYATWSAPLQAYAAGERRLDIALLPERRVRLRVLDAARRPLRASVEFHDGGPLPLELADNAWRRVTQLRADARGELLAAGLPAARLTARVRHAGRVQDFALDLRTEPHDVIELQLDGPPLVPLVLWVFAAGKPEAPPTAPDAASLGEQLAQGLLQPLDVEATLRVTDAAGAALAEAALGAQADAEDLAATQAHWPQARRAARVRLLVPAGPELVLTVQAPGCAAWTRSLTLDAQAAELELVAVLAGS